MSMVGAFGQPCVEHHTAVIFDRGGSRRIRQIVDLAEVSYGRALDKKSLGSITVSGRACVAQATILNQIIPRRMELVLYRGTERVWEGPILQCLSTSNSFTIDASDAPLTYLEGAAMSVAYPAASLSSIKTQRLASIIANELTTPYTMVTTDTPGGLLIPRWETVTPPANIQPFLEFRHNPDTASATQTTTDTEAFQMTVAAHLYDLTANGGIHFTTVGRRLAIWDSNLVIGRLRVVSEKDFTGDFNVIQAGSDFATIDHVIGTQTDDTTQPPVVGHAATDFSVYGPWERVDPTSSENASQNAPDIGALNSQAKARVKALYPLPLLLESASGASLKVGPGLTFNQLIPGVEVPVVAKGNIRIVKQTQRIDTVAVTETAANGEQIKITLGATDDAVVF